MTTFKHVLIAVAVPTAVVYAIFHVKFLRNSITGLA